MMRIAWMAVPIALAAALGARADITLDSRSVAGGPPTIDGQVDEWYGDAHTPGVAFVPLTDEDRVGGGGEWESKDDASAELAVAHDDKALYLVVCVHDQRFVRTRELLVGEDHVELWVGLPEPGGGDESFGIGVFADPARYQAPVEIRWLKSGGAKAGKPVPGAKAAVAGDERYYTVEMAIPWSALPGGKARRNGMRAAVYVVDGDLAAKPEEKSVLGTAPLAGRGDPRVLPLFAPSDTAGALDAFLNAVGLPDTQAIAFSAEVDLTGDREKERLLVVDRYLVAHGPVFGGSNAFTYHELSIPRAEMIARTLLNDITGDGKPEIILELLEDNGTTTRRWVEIYRITPERAFGKIFAAALYASSTLVVVENTYRFVADKGKAKAIELKPGRVEGISEGDVAGGVPEADGTPMVMPWDTPPKARYVFRDGRYRTE